MEYFEKLRVLLGQGDSSISGPGNTTKDGSSSILMKEGDQPEQDMSNVEIAPDGSIRGLKPKEAPEFEMNLNQGGLGEIENTSAIPGKFRILVGYAADGTTSLYPEGLKTEFFNQNQNQGSAKTTAKSRKEAKDAQALLDQVLALCELPVAMEPSLLAALRVVLSTPPDNRNTLSNGEEDVDNQALNAFDSITLGHAESALLNYLQGAESALTDLELDLEKAKQYSQRCKDDSLRCKENVKSEEKALELAEKEGRELEKQMKKASKEADVAKSKISPAEVLRDAAFNNYLDLLNIIKLYEALRDWSELEVGGNLREPEKISFEDGKKFWLDQGGGSRYTNSGRKSVAQNKKRGRNSTLSSSDCATGSNNSSDSVSEYSDESESGSMDTIGGTAGNGNGGNSSSSKSTGSATKRLRSSVGTPKTGANSPNRNAASSTTVAGTLASFMSSTPFGSASSHIAGRKSDATVSTEAALNSPSHDSNLDGENGNNVVDQNVEGVKEGEVA